MEGRAFLDVACALALVAALLLGTESLADFVLQQGTLPPRQASQGPVSSASSWIAGEGVKYGVLAALVCAVPCLRVCSRWASLSSQLRPSRLAGAWAAVGPAGSAAAGVGRQGPQRGGPAGRAAEPPEVRVLCINLESFEDRWQYSQAWAAQTPGVRLERSLAFDGRTAPEADVLKAREHWRGRGPFQPGMLGCFLSHASTWSAIAAGAPDFAVVAEDDAGPRCRETFCEEVYDVVQRLAGVAGGWDLVLLDEHEWMATGRLQTDEPLDGLPPPGWGESRVDRCWQQLLQDGRRRQNAGDMADQAALYRVLCRLYDEPLSSDDGAPSWRSPVRLLRVAGDFEGTHGLLWSRRGAARAAELAERDGVRDQVDAMLWRWASAGELSIFKTFPPLMRVEERLGRVSTTQPGRGPDGLALDAA